MRSYEAEVSLCDLNASFYHPFLENDGSFFCFVFVLFGKIADYKRKLFEKLAGKAETVLEIGVGTGPNLKYFAGNENVCVFGMDPNHKMEKYACESAREAGMKPENFRFMHGVSINCSVLICETSLFEPPDVSSMLILGRRSYTIR